VLVAASVIVSAFLAPLLASWWERRTRSALRDAEKVNAGQA
jgi:hypothetical protein